MSETLSVSLPDKTVSITMHLDDTVETVRMRIGIAAGIHPDKLRIYVQADLPSDYYSKDSRRWEIVFLRMSPDGKPIKKASLDLFSAHTDPAWTIDEPIIDKSNWMLLSPKRESTFTELRMLGTTEDKSWILPLDNTTEPPYAPAASMVSIQTNSLFNSLHPYSVKGFRVIPYAGEIRPTIELLYFPLLRSGSPAIPPEEIARSIFRQDTLLKVLLERDSPAPTRQVVLRARWKIPMVDTDFGLAPRNRFEQIFYGTTVSKTTPSLSFFGSRQEQSRHKFYTESKKPFTDLRAWQYWWTATKPTKNKPAVLFYRGTGRFMYDRITVNSTEITVSSHRLEDSEDDLDSLQSGLKKWLLSIDGLSAFLDPTDLDESRWVMQDVAVFLKYSKELTVGDFRRFGCLRGLYEVIDHNKLLFKFLRSNQADLGLTSNELRVVQMLKENEFASASEIAEELHIGSDEAGSTLSSVKEKLEDNPDLLDRQYSNLPTFRFSASTAVVTYAIDIRRIVKYINILRDILMNPESSDLDDVCPSRMETIESASAEVSVVQKEDDLDLGFLDDLLGEIASANVVAAPEVSEVVAPRKSKKIATKGTQKTLASYLLTQLREFDSETYDPEDTQILRKCDKPRQPIILTPADVIRLEDSPYDVRTRGDANVLDVEDPNGRVICPPYWCTFDRIPLIESQLGEGGVCPICGGKVRSTDKNIEKTQDVTEFPVIQRDSSIVFPGYVKYKSKKNGRPIPCCFTTAQTTKVGVPKSETPSTAEAFYVLGESKTKLTSLRLGYIPRIVGKALTIPLDYKETISAGNRIQAGQSGFFRVGVGHAAETLPQILQFTGTIKSPINNVDVTMRCSFFRSWRGTDEDADIPASFKYSDSLAKRVASIDKAFKNKMLSSLEELEYSAIALDCQLFILYVSSEQVQIGCFMNIGAVRSVNRAVSVMIGDAGDPEYISHVARITTSPQFTANLYKSVLYPPQILKTLINMRQKACTSDVPTIDSTFALITSLPSLKGRIPEMKVVLDPYGRAQAVFIPKVVILPFKPTSQIPTFLDKKITGYSDIAGEELPYKNDMIDFLKEAVRFHAGFEYMHDVGNQSGKVVELITSSGLRIPVQSDDYTKAATEITETVSQNEEATLVWGGPDVVASKDAKAITYEAEVFDFLLYQLSYDIQNGEDYRALKKVLAQDRPKVEEVSPLLHDWADSTLTFSEADSPPDFVRKIRSPCAGKNSCDGNLCAWNGASCKVEIKKVRAGLDRVKLEKRLLSMLVSNEKIRDIVWQNKTSPFFSSVLYLEMPNELILSDADVSKLLKA